MVRLLRIFLVCSAICSAAVVEGIKQVPCSAATERMRNEIIQETLCREPKDVIVTFDNYSPNQQISPGAVWVKNCVGYCGDVDRCIPLTKQTKIIPVRIWNIGSNKESCATVTVVEHLSCGCGAAN